MSGLGLFAMMATNWTPGLLVLGAGVLVTLFVLFSTRRQAAPAVRDEKLADLEQRLHTLLDQLRGLESERHQLGDSFPVEKSRLEREAAQAMRARDEYLVARTKAGQQAPNAPAPAAAANVAASATRAATPAPAPAPAAGGLLSPQLRGALWGAGVVLFFVAVGFTLQKWQADRGEDDIMTGRTPPQPDLPAAPPAAQEHPGLEEALTRAKADPRDLEASSFATHELIRLQRFDEAETLTNQTLAVDPFHVEARIHRAVLRATQGEFKPALEELDRLGRTYPDAWEAHLFRGALALQVGESELALDSFLRFQAEAPSEEHPPQLQGAISMLRQRLAQGQ